MAKENKMNPMIILAVIAIGLFVWMNPGDEVTPPTPDTGVACGVEDVSFNAKMTRVGKAGTSLSTADNNYYILEDSLGTVLANAATTVPVDYNMEVIFGENSTAYYSVVDTVNVKCADPHYEAVSLAYAAAPSTKYIENTDGTVNSATNKEPLGADDSVTITLFVKSSADEFFGNPDVKCIENVGVVEYDKTYILKASSDDTTTLSTNFFAFSNTSIYDGKATFALPKTSDGSRESVSLTFESTSSDFTGTNYPIVYMYDCDVDKNEDNLALIWGIEDEDNNKLSIAETSLTVYLS